MKNFSKLFLLVVFLSIFISTPAFALTPKVVTTPAQAIILADVNIKDANIISQEGNIFKISFSIINGKGLQTGVKYGVKLVSNTPNGQITIDEKIYPESLTLYENKTIQKELTYSAPLLLSGKYTLYLTSRNESGFPFSTAFVKDVELKATKQGLEISPESCSLSVVGENGSPTYKLNQIVDIALTETLSLTCSVTNNSKEIVTATPSFVTTLGTVYGKLATTDTGDITPISFKASEKKSFSITLPKASIAGIYYLTVGLKQGETLSNKVSLSYIIRGNIASISNLFLDKDYYQKGDTANLSFMWNSISGKLLRGDTGKDSSISITVSILDIKDKECAVPVTKPLAQDFTKPKTELPITITKDCFNPEVTVSLKDSEGNVLDQKNFKAETASVKQPVSYILYLIILLIIIIIAIYLYKNKKNKKDNISNSIPLSIIFPFFFLALFSLMPMHKASASTFYIGTSGCGGVTFDVGIDKTSYWRGQQVVASGSEYSQTNSGSLCMWNSFNSGLIASTDPSDYYLSSLPSQYKKTIYSGYDASRSGSVFFDIYPTGPYSITFLGRAWDSVGGYQVYGNSSAFSYTVKTTSMMLVPANYSTSIPYGSTINISWAMAPTFDFFGPYIVSCTPSEADGYSSAASGTFTTPALYATKTYNISCLDSKGYTATGTTTINVDTPPALPDPTVTITANGVAGNITVPYNAAVPISWTSTNATTCTCTYGPSNLSCGTGAAFIGNSTPAVPINIPSNFTATTTINVTCSN